MHAVAEKDHARLGPSSWDRWSNCPGSVALTDQCEKKTSIYAAEGSIAHEVADRVLRGEVAKASDLLGEMFEIEGHSIEVDEEMVDAVDFYVEYVRSLVPEDSDVLFPEQAVPIGHLTGETGATGTSDAIAIANHGKLMHVADLKYGKGVRVNAEGNGQARMYALGALHKLGPVFEDVEEVETHIIMPRLEDGVTSEVLSMGELEEFKDEVELAAAAVQMADYGFPADGVLDDWAEIHLVPGEKQCKFCDAAGVCPALRKEMSKSMALVSDCTADDFADLTLPKQAAKIEINESVPSKKLSEFLRAVPLIEAAITAVRAEVERRLFAGEDVPGFYLGVGRKGNRRWADEETARKALVKRGRLTKADAYELKLISPATAEKKLGKDVLKLLAEQGVVVQDEGKPSVCAEGDKNPPYVPVSAEDFADLSITAQSEAERLLG